MLAQHPVIQKKKDHPTKQTKKPNPEVLKMSLLIKAKNI